MSTANDVFPSAHQTDFPDHQAGDPVRSPTRSIPAWQRARARMLVTTDLAAIAISIGAALVIRFGDHATTHKGHAYLALSFALAPLWVGALVWFRAYEARFLGTGAEEFKRVAAASFQLAAIVGLISYVGKLELARGYVAIAFPLGAVLLLAGRYIARRWVQRRRTAGEYLHSVVAVGSREAVKDLRHQLERDPGAGFAMTAICLPTHQRGFPLQRGGDDRIDGVPVLGSLVDVPQVVRTTGADTVAVLPGPGISGQSLRTLAWQLEGMAVDLVVSPSLTDVAGPRISIRPVAGLPLLHVDEPELGGLRQLLKSVVERILAFVGLVLMAPVLAALVIAIRSDSPGAAIFRQVRVGRSGKTFTVYKLRTMFVDAESRLAELRASSDGGNSLLFKMRADPRITRVGAVLRKFSLDELPQLINVVRGDMALVGPRPPLPSEVSESGPDFARRLLVRPGITGLWQVSGRSDLSLEDSVRLDLHYVENWTLGLDVLIMLKTLGAVLQHRGAY